MKSTLLSSILYNKYLEKNKLIGVTYYPSKRKGFQFLLIVKSGIKVDFIKYNFVSYKELFNIENGDELIVSSEEMVDMVKILDKIYIPIRNIQGYSYEPTRAGFNTFLRIKNNNGKDENRLISRFEKDGLNLLDDGKNFASIMCQDIIEDEGFMKVNQEPKKTKRDEFKKLKLGINDTICDLFYI